jgi:hypothetical protein
MPLRRKSTSVSLVLIGTAAFLAACGTGQHSAPRADQTTGTATRRASGHHFWIWPWWGGRSSRTAAGSAALAPQSGRGNAAVSGASEGSTRGGMFGLGSSRGGFGGMGRSAAGG